MSTPTLKTRLLTNGKSSWRITRVSDYCFTAKSSWKAEATHKWQGVNAMAEAIAFEDFLCRKGFSLLQRGRSLATLKKQPAAVA